METKEERINSALPVDGSTQVGLSTETKAGLPFETLEMEGYKNTKLGWIPEYWKVVKIGDIGDVGAGGTPSTAISKYWNGEIRWMNSGELNLKYVYEVDGRITDLGLKNSSAKLLPKNCVLIGLAGQGRTRGTVAINKVELSTNQSVAFIISNQNKVFYQFLFYNLDFRYEELRRLSTGESGRGGLNLSIIKNIKIAKPPLPEQQKIAQILSTWDRAINKTEKLIRKKQLRKKGLMQQLLTGKKRFKEFVKSEISKIEFGEVVERSKLKYDPKKSANNFPCIELEHIEQETGQLLGFTDSKSQASIKNYFKQGEVLFGKLRPYLKKYINPSFEGVCSSEIWVLKSKNEKALSHRFLFYLVQSHKFIQACKATTGSKMPRADWNYISETPFSVPTKQEQKKIASVLSSADQEIQNLQNQLDKLKNQKKGLMQKLLTGEIRTIY